MPSINTSHPTIGESTIGANDHNMDMTSTFMSDGNLTDNFLALLGGRSDPLALPDIHPRRDSLETSSSSRDSLRETASESRRGSLQPTVSSAEEVEEEDLDGLEEEKNTAQVTREGLQQQNRASATPPSRRAAPVPSSRSPSRFPLAYGDDDDDDDLTASLGTPTGKSTPLALPKLAHNTSRHQTSTFPSPSRDATPATAAILAAMNITSLPNTPAASTPRPAPTPPRTSNSPPMAPRSSDDAETDLRAQLAALRSQLATETAARKAAEAQTLVKAAEAERAVTVAQNTLRQRVRALQAGNLEKDARMAELSAKLEDRDAELRDRDAEIDALYAEQEALVQRVESAEEAVKKEKEKGEVSASKTKTTTTKTNTETQQASKTNAQTINALVAELTASRSELTSLRSTLSTTKSNLKTSHQSAQRTLQTKASALSSELRDVRTQLAALQATHAAREDEWDARCTKLMGEVERRGEALMLLWGEKECPGVKDAGGRQGFRYRFGGRVGEGAGGGRGMKMR